MSRKASSEFVSFLLSLSTRYPGLSSISISYSGSGDDGGIDDTSLAFDAPLTPPQELFDGDSLSSDDQEKLESFVFNECADSWGFDNDGCQGTLTITLHPDLTIHCDHSYNEMSSHEAPFDLEI